MRTCADRLQQIENLLGLVDHLELEPAASVQLEADLLVAYSLVRIEQHLAGLGERRAEPFAVPQAG
jgi:hypothetical protein